MKYINTHQDAQNDFNNKIDKLLNNKNFTYLNKYKNFNNLVLNEKQRLLNLNPITTPQNYSKWLITSMNCFIEKFIDEYNKCKNN